MLQHVKREGWIWMLMQLHTLGCLKSRWWRREAEELLRVFLPTVTKSGGTSVNIRAVQYFIVSEGG